MSNIVPNANTLFSEIDLLISDAADKAQAAADAVAGIDAASIQQAINDAATAKTAAENAQTIALGATTIGNLAYQNTITLDTRVTALEGGTPMPAAGFTYSTTETTTGNKWIDGSPIYAKTISVGPLPNKTSKSVTHGITGMTNLIRAEAYAKNSSSTAFISIDHPISLTTGQYGISFDITNTNISISASTNLSAYTSAYVTIFYTK